MKHHYDSTNNHLFPSVIIINYECLAICLPFLIQKLQHKLFLHKVLFWIYYRSTTWLEQDFAFSLTLLLICLLIFIQVTRSCVKIMYDINYDFILKCFTSSITAKVTVDWNYRVCYSKVLNDKYIISIQSYCNYYSIPLKICSTK